MILRYIASPVVGGIIGYCTNYLAVKMLFLPRREIRVFGHRLPFTPGVIPKGKPRLAKAVGSIISSMLLTQSDLSEKLSSDEVCDAISEKVCAVFDKPLKETLLAMCADETSYVAMKEKGAEVVSQKILNAVLEADFASVIESEGIEAVKEKVAGTMLQMFVTDDLIRSFLSPLTEKINLLLKERGGEYIKSRLMSEMAAGEEKSIIELLSSLDVKSEQLQSAVNALCKQMIPVLAVSLAEKMDIAQIIEDKMNAMDVMELENLVLSVMKNELDTIVNLGALIGAVLGTINIFF